MTKTQKVQLINKYLSKSEFSQKKEAKAEILEDGRIQYTMRIGRHIVKASYREILATLHGKDMRELHAKLNG